MKSSTVSAVVFVRFANVLGDGFGTVSLIRVVAALGDSVAEGGGRQAQIVRGAEEMSGRFADFLTVLLVGTVAAIVLAVAHKVVRDANLVGARELVDDALLIGTHSVLVRHIACANKFPIHT